MRIPSEDGRGIEIRFIICSKQEARAMAIITISRGSLSMGTILAEKVARALDYECVSREAIIKESACEYGLEKEELTIAMEKPPTFWERFTHGRRLYLAVMRAALLDRACSGKLVYHGLSGHFLLKGIKCVLKVRLIAPMDMRIRAAMEEKQLKREDAEYHIRDVDEKRSRWTKYLYGVDWRDPYQFDLIINLETMTLSTAKELICQTIKRPEFQVCITAMDDLENLALAAKVEAFLAADIRTRSVNIDIEALNGVVRLRGMIETENLRPTIIEVVKRIQTIKSVEDELVVQSISPLPT